MCKNSENIIVTSPDVGRQQGFSNARLQLIIYKAWILKIRKAKSNVLKGFGFWILLMKQSIPNASCTSTNIALSDS